MDEKYYPQKIEQKWQRRWAENKTFETEADDARPKFYALEMLPYPSGRLHIGHVRNYSIGDALAWYKRLQGFNVLHPIGWDSFGQPAEQAAIKKGVNPREWTEENITQMRGQLQRLGISYDWRREIAAHRPEYYKFDQWFFLKMLELGLAYKKMTKVNWCPNDQTTLSNEQASGGVCWRCGHQVEKKDLAQWFLRITAYAEELLAGMEEIEAGWAERVLTMQRNWIGKSEGAFVEFKVLSAFRRLDADNENASDNKRKPPEGTQNIRVFTTRIDTIYGANAIVVAAEHPIIESRKAELSEAVLAKIEEIKIEKAKPTDYGEEPEKDGIDTGLKAVNPFSGEELPVWIGNYVMMEYGTGAVMSVPAHDERDFEFANKFDLPIRPVISRKAESSSGEAQIPSREARIPSTEAQIPSSEVQIPSREAHIPSTEARLLTENRHIPSRKADFLNDNSTDSEGKSAVSDQNPADSVEKSAVSDQDSTFSVEESANELAEAFSDYGVLINSGEWTGKSSDEAKQEMAEFAKANDFGEAATTYRLRDWGISRQRFWGAPIPIVYCEKCGAVPEKYENLPIRLPETAPFTGVGESPLARVPEFVNTVCPNCSEPATRETDTMDTFVDSSWYYFRYADPTNTEQPFDPQIAAYWLPVDQYIGGVDHAVMHLLYTRFWAKAMRDIGLISFDEPIENLLTQGMVVGESFYSESKSSYVEPEAVEVVRDAKGKVEKAFLIEDETTIRVAIEKMSKSKYNGVDPDEMVGGRGGLDDGYGADATRLFVMFAAPAENELVWKEEGVEGTRRFLQKVWRQAWRWNAELKRKPESAPAESSAEAKALRRKTHQTIKRVTENFENFQFNTPIAAMMELSNALGDFKTEPSAADEADLYAVDEALKSLTLMLAPYAPHFAEEMWEILTGSEQGILQSGARFPIADEALAKAEEIEIPIQVNGKLRSRLTVAPDTAKDELEKLALENEKAKEHTSGKQIVKIVVVPNRLVNIVVK